MTIRLTRFQNLAQQTWNRMDKRIHITIGELIGRFSSSNYPRHWKEDEKGKRFTSNLLEAIYVYDNEVKYWEDIRCSRSSDSLKGNFIVSL